jgi:murein DD-endopeptidase MepM/ murein hydrolase activator NlpD
MRQQLELWDEYDFHLEESKRSVLVQLADLIGGSVAYSYDESKKNNADGNNYVSLLKDKILHIRHFPETFDTFQSPKNSARKGWDPQIANICYRKALSFIKENEKTQEDLEDKIVENEENSVKLTKTLKKYNLDVMDVSEEHEDASQLYEAAKEAVKTFEPMYKKLGCKETETINECMDAPYSDGLVRPTTKGKVTSEFGMRLHPTLGYYRMHNGIDIAVGTGTPVYAATNGVVTTVSKVKNPNKANSSCGGNAVYVSHTVKGKKVTTVYMHLHTINVKVGEYVLLNTVIGTSGGGEKYDYCTTGPHLHFGVKVSGSYVNPRNYIDFPARYKNWSSRW